MEYRSGILVGIPKLFFDFYMQINFSKNPNFAIFQTYSQNFVQQPGRSLL